MSKLHRRTHNREWERVRRQVLERDGHRCRECGKAGRLEVHHKLELQKGGGNDVGNLRTLCRSCHIAIHKKPVDADWEALLGDL